MVLLDRDLRLTLATPRWRAEHAALLERVDGLTMLAAGIDVPMGWLRACQRALLGEELHHPGETWRRPDGAQRCLRWWARPWRGEFQQICGVMLTVEDITQERENARALSELQVRTQQYARLGADLFWELDAEFRFRLVSAVNSPDFWNSTGPVLGEHAWGLLSSQQLLPELAEQRAVLEAHLPFLDLVTERRLPNGEVQWLSWNGDPRFTEAGRFDGYIGTTRDITQRQLTQHALQLSEMRLSMALHASGHALWEFDLATGHATLFAGYAEMLGYEPGWLLPSVVTWDSMLHPDDREAVLTVFRGLMGRGGEVFETQFRLRCHGGGWCSVRCRGMVAPDGHHLVCVNADITAQEDAQLREDLAALVFGHVQHGMVVTDITGLVIAANQAFTDIMEMESEAVIGAPIGELLAPAEAHAVPLDWSKMLASADSWEGEVWHTRGSGETFQAWMTVTPLLDDRKRVIRRVFLLTDLSRMKHARSELEVMAYQDALTGLANRRQLDARLSYTLAHARREKQPFALIMLDLDGFKLVNDTSGHPAGDELLVAIGRRLKALLREVDLVARLGGDEFVLILERADIAGALRVAVKVLEIIANPLLLSNGQSGRVTASLGMAEYPKDGDDSSSLLSLADRRLYRAKAAGRNCAVFDESGEVIHPGRFPLD